jgi:hypothetical protein
MRHFRRTLIAIAATAALVGAAGGTTPAAATQQNGLVNVYARNVANNNQVVLLQNVTIVAAANFCAVDIGVLSVQLQNQPTARCTAKSNAAQHAWVAYSPAAGEYSGADQNGPVNIAVEDVASGNQVVILQNVSIPVAANICGVALNVLTVQLRNYGRTMCAPNPGATGSGGWICVWLLKPKTPPAPKTPAAPKAPAAPRA